MRATLAAVCLALFAVSEALAADPVLRMSELPEGTIVNYVHEDGSETSAVFYGKEDRGWRARTYSQPNAKGSPSGDYLLNDRGERLTFTSAGNEFSYEPHNCQRTLGSCRYRVKNRNTGQTFRLERTMKALGEDKFSHEIYLLGSAGSQRYEVGRYAVGEYGLLTSFSWERRGANANAEIVEIVFP